VILVLQIIVEPCKPLTIKAFLSSECA